MSILDIFSSIIINAGIAHGFIIAALFGRYKNQSSHFLLSSLLIILSLIIFRIHYLQPLLLERLGSIFFGSGPFIFLLGPFLFFYLRSIVRPGAGITKKDLGHFSFFVIFLGLIIPQYIYGIEGTYSLYLERFLGSPWIFLVFQFGYYLIQTRRLVKMHKKNIVEKFSNVEGMDVSWLNLIIWLFVLILLFITVATPWLIHGFDLASYYTTSSIFFSLILFLIAYKGIQQRIPQDSNVNNEPDQNVSDRDTILRLKDQLITYMETNKPYLNPELTLTDLAQQLSISRNQLSQVINNGVGDNFYNLINKFRVEEVKGLIKKDAARQFTILSLANDAGFNSKSSFNHIFKKMTGLTPSEYRNGQI